MGVRRRRDGGERNLSGQDDEETADEAEALLVVSLHDGDGPDGVGVTATVRDAAVGEDGDNDVLLDVEGARVEAQIPTKQMAGSGGEGPSHELADGQDGDLHQDGGDDERLRAVSEESVEKDEEDA